MGGPADGGPVLVVGGHGQEVRDVALVDELLGFLEEAHELGHALVGQAFVAGHAADHGELGVRVLGAEHGHGAGGLDLQVQGFQVVGRGDEVDFGRQVVGVVAAEEVGVGEDAELAGVHQALDLVLHGLEVFGLGLAGGDGVGDGGGLLRVRGQGCGHVDPVQGVQVVEVHDVVMQELRGQDEVADEARVVGQVLVHADGVVHAAGRGQGVGVGAHAAGTLGEVLGVARVASFQDQLEAAEELRARPDVGDLALVDFDFDLEMAFDAGHGVDDDGPLEVLIHWGGDDTRGLVGFATGHMFSPLDSVMFVPDATADYASS